MGDLWKSGSSAGKPYQWTEFGIVKGTNAKDYLFKVISRNPDKGDIQYKMYVENVSARHHHGAGALIIYGYDKKNLNKYRSLRKRTEWYIKWCKLSSSLN